MLIFYLICIRTFLLNGITAHVLLDSGVARSFVSLALRKKFSYAPEILECPLEIEIADHSVSSSRIHRGYVLNIFNERYFID